MARTQMPVGTQGSPITPLNRLKRFLFCRNSQVAPVSTPPPQKRSNHSKRSRNHSIYVAPESNPTQTQKNTVPNNSLSNFSCQKASKKQPSRTISRYAVSDHPSQGVFPPALQGVQKNKENAAKTIQKKARSIMARKSAQQTLDKVRKEKFLQLQNELRPKLKETLKETLTAELRAQNIPVLDAKESDSTPHLLHSFITTYSTQLRDLPSCTTMDDFKRIFQSNPQLFERYLKPISITLFETVFSSDIETLNTRKEALMNSSPM